MKKSETIKSRYIMGVLILLVSFWGAMTYADSPKDSAQSEAQPAASEAKPSHLEQVRVATLKQEMPRQKREDLAKMFDDIAAGIEKLKGKAIWSKDPKPTAESIENFGIVLNAAVEKVHPEVAAAVLFDTTQDDYVRQIALGVLIRYKGEPVGDDNAVPAHKGYTMAHLPLLCKVLVFPAGPQKAESFIYRRVWATPEIARVRLAEWIGHVLNLDVDPKKDDDDSPIVTNLAMSNPKLWLKNVLQHALTLERSKEDKEIIRTCLATLK